MTATNHALTGAIIGLTLHNPLIAIPAALISHLVCDMIPHYGGGNPNAISTPSFARYLVVDGSLCVLLVIGLAASGTSGWLLASICAFVATSPDLLSIRKFRAARAHKQIKQTKLEMFLKNIQWFERPIGATVELAWLTSSLLILRVII